MNFDDLTRDDVVRLLIYGSIALYVAVQIPRLFRGRILIGLLALVFWASILLVTIAGYAYRYELQGVGQRIMAVAFPGTVIEVGPKEVAVFRRPDGEFIVQGTVGKVRVPFVLDTGASTVVLRAEDAARLGIPLRHLTYDIEVSTANGRALTASIQLPALTIGSITQQGVEALVARPGAMHENLLGMSFLNMLASFTISNDKLVLRGK